MNIFTSLLNEHPVEAQKVRGEKTQGQYFVPLFNRKFILIWGIIHTNQAKVLA